MRKGQLCSNVIVSWDSTLKDFVKDLHTNPSWILVPQN